MSFDALLPVRCRRRDRRILIAAAAGAAVLVLSVASSRGEEDTGASKRSTLPRPVYAEGSDRLQFSHAAHAGTSCTTCHGGAAESTSADDDLRPSMSVCADCHTDRAEPALETCSGCHAGYTPSVDGDIDKPEDWRQVDPAPMPSPERPPDLTFDHARHVEAIRAPGTGSTGDACRSCHGSPADGGISMPEMEQCADCHDSAKPGAPRETCDTCHTTEPRGGGTSASNRPASSSDDRASPADHGPDWLARHGTVARSSSTRCTDCHTERDCASCHEEESARPFAVHPPNFDSLHAAQPRASTDGCTDCHQPETFCASCHARSGVSASPPDRPPPGRDVHPPGWTNPGGTGNHAAMARRNITECASCHTEQDCKTCHTQVDPHPPDFRTQCGNWLKADPTPCKQCHGDIDRLRDQCL
ncbi:MAG: cytochrome c3 family protein [Bradymonadaceae bacterium]